MSFADALKSVLHGHDLRSIELEFRVGFKLINKSAVLPFTRYLLYVVKNWSDDELDRELDILPRTSRRTRGNTL